MKLVSACLAGYRCRWDGQDSCDEKIVEMVRKGEAIPVCPEQLGGLTTPRIPQEQQRDGRVVNRKYVDVTEQFNRGAYEVLRLAEFYGATEFIGKLKSPSCGCNKIYDGTFSATLIDGDGVTVQLLKQNEIKCYTERDL